MLLTVYVDDFKVAGPAKNLEEVWKLIKDVIDIEKPAEVGHYLGCLHRKYNKEIGGHQISVMEYDMEDYLKNIVDDYEQLSSEILGEGVTLTCGNPI